MLIPPQFSAVLTLLVLAFSSQINASTISTACNDSSLNGITKSAQRSLTSNSPKMAYQTLMRCEGRYASSAKFSYLLGLSALRSGDIDTAIFTLERTLMIQPDHQSACYALAKALYTNGEYRTAKAHFEWLLSNIHPSHHDHIKRYISAIDSAVGLPAAEQLVAVRVGLGRNYNANSATEDNNFLGVILSSNSLARSANYGELSVSGEIQEPIAPSWYVSAAVDAERTSFANNKDLLSDVLSLSVGLNWQRASSHVQLAGRSSRLRLENTSYLQQTLLESRWFESISDQVMVGAGLQLGTLRYEPNSAIRDLNIRGIWSLASWQLPTEDNWNIKVQLRAYNNAARDNISPYGHKQLSKSVNLTYKHGNTWLASFSGGYSKINYDRPFFGLMRDDLIKEVSLNTEFFAIGTDNCSVQAHAKRRSQDSTVSLYEFSGNEFGVSWGCEFK